MGGNGASLPFELRQGSTALVVVDMQTLAMKYGCVVMSHEALVELEA